MNDHVSPPLDWDDSRAYKRGKVLNAEQLEKLQRFGRYLDVDDDGITYRTYPGTHPTKGSFFTRGTSRDEYATYTEDGGAYRRNMDRLIKKWNTAKGYVPAPQIYNEQSKSRNGILFYGTSQYAAEEAIELMEQQGITLDALRIKSFPFTASVEDFINSHDRVFVIDQNRDAQMKSLLMIELGADPAKLVSILNYDGMPITADNIMNQVTKKLSAVHA
jgi:2-oxoglutarate ferredoxin oxidoreductase subunit alpha